ncbi:MAG TPA: UPF0175 family protein [Thermoanaerobaculia bacterium]|nr:UPF0175 family protein [Thermoanaerobaculia bacterium]
MNRLTISIPDEILEALGVDSEQAAAELRLVAAMKLFELGRLSSGAAAELAGVPKPVFLKRLGEYGVPAFSATPDDLREDIAFAAS